MAFGKLEWLKFIRLKFNKMNKKQLSAWGIIGIFLLSWVGFVIFSNLSGNGALEVQVEKHLASVASSKAERIGTFLDERKVDLEFLVGLDKVTSSFEAGAVDSELAKELESFRKVNGYLDLILIDIDGSVLWSSSNKGIIGTNLGGIDSELGRVFDKVQNDFGVGIFDPGYFNEGEKLSVFVTSPVLVESESVMGKMDMLGIVALQIDNKEIEGRVVSDVGLEGGKIYLVNKDATPISELIGEDGRQIVKVETVMVKDCFKNYQNYYFERSGQKVNLIGKSGIYDGYSGEKVFGAHDYILRTGWCVLVEKEELECS